MVSGPRRSGRGWSPTSSPKKRELKVISIKYDYFDALRFWCPVGTRLAPVREVLRLMRDAMARYPSADVSVLAHSFGTYAVGRILRDEPDIRLSAWCCAARSCPGGSAGTTLAVGFARR